MPYRVKGKMVQHLKNGRWAKKQVAGSHEKALAALRLLNAIEHNPDFKPRGR